MSKRNVNKLGWGVSRWSDDIIISSIRPTREQCMFEYAQAHPNESLEKFLAMGFKCIEVRITSVDTPGDDNE